MTLQDLALLVLAYMEGSGGVVPITSWLRTRLGTSGILSLLVAAVVSVVFGIVTAASLGQLDVVNWGNIAWVSGAIFLSSQAYYRTIPKDRA